jgi:hypothetical protein
MVMGKADINRSTAYLSPKHAQNLTALIVDDGLRLLVVQHGHGEAPLIGRVHSKVEVPQVGEALVAGNRVRDDVLAGRVGVLGGGKAPAYKRQLVVLFSSGIFLVWWTYPWFPYANAPPRRK